MKQKLRKGSAVLLALVMLLSLFSFSTAFAAGEISVDIYPSSVQMSGNDYEFLVADIADEGFYSNLSYKWSSSNSSIVSVDGNGDFATIQSGTKSGTATITLTVSGTVTTNDMDDDSYPASSQKVSGTATCTVRVDAAAPTDPLVAQINGSSNVFLNAGGDSDSISAFVSGGSGNYSYSWSKSGDFDIYGSNDECLVSSRNTAVNNGRVTLTVKDTGTGESKTLTWYVTVNQTSDPLTVNLSRGSIDMGQGISATLMAEASGGSGNYSYSWSSSNSNIVSVSGQGSSANLYASSAGDATITLRVSDGQTSTSASCSVHVSSSGKDISYNVTSSCQNGTGMDFSNIAQQISSKYQSSAGTSLDYTAPIQFSTTSTNVGSIAYQNGSILSPNTNYQFSSFYSTVIFNPIQAGTFTTRYTVRDGENTVSGTITINVSGGSSPRITGVTISPSGITMDTYSSRSVSVNVTPSYADYTVSWSCSNTNVISISGSGTAVTVNSYGTTGNATVTATVYDNTTGSSYERTCSINVRGGGGGGGSYNPSLNLTYGSDYYGTGVSDSIYREFYNRYGIYLPSSAIIRFSSLDTYYGQMMLYNGNYARTGTNYSFSDFKNMFFEPLRVGTWTGTYDVSYNGYSLSGTMYVYIRGSSLSATITPSSISLPTYSNQYVSVRVTPSNSYYTVAWGTSNGSIATVNGNGSSATVYSQGKSGTATISATITDRNGNQIIKKCTVTVTNSGNNQYSPSMSTTIGSTTMGTTIYDSLRAQFSNVYGMSLSDNAVIRFDNTGNSAIAVRKMSNGKAVSANTNYTMGDYKNMYTDPVSVGTFSTPYTLTFNNNTLKGNITINIEPAPVNVSISLNDANPYSFGTALPTGSGASLLNGALNNALAPAASASWSYIRFSNSTQAVGTLYADSFRSPLTTTTNVTSATMSNLYFVPAQAGTFITDITAYNAVGNVVAKGTLYIIVPGSVGPNPAGLVVQPTNQAVTCNGVPVDTEVYNINGANYFKLRDLAMMLNHTSSQFEVGYDDPTRTITVETGKAYTPIGTELVKGPDQSATCVYNSMAIYINGTAVNLTAFNIGGSTFFQLRELGNQIGFNVGYDEATRTVLITSR